MVLTWRDTLLAAIGFLLAGLTGHLLPFAPYPRARKRSRRWEHVATHDDLSDLHNRAGFLGALHAAPSADRPYGLVLLDLDHFKTVNDTLGHPAGNALLARVGQRLSNLVGPTVLAAGRLSGDEFALLVAGDRDQIRAAATAALHAITAAPIDLDGGPPIAIGASAGYTRAALGVSAAQLLRQADDALYQAKATGRGRVHGAGPTTGQTARPGGPRPRDHR